MPRLDMPAEKKHGQLHRSRHNSVHPIKYHKAKTNNLQKKLSADSDHKHTKQSTEPETRIRTTGQKGPQLESSSRCIIEICC